MTWPKHHLKISLIATLVSLLVDTSHKSKNIKINKYNSIIIIIY